MEMDKSIALVHLDAIDEIQERILSLALAAAAYQETREPELQDSVLANLLGLIRDEADRTSPASALRKMIEPPKIAAVAA